MRRFALRTRTADLHQKLDDVVGSFDSRAAYARYLQALAAFRLPLEAALERARWPRRWGAWRPLTVGPALKADLAELNLPLPSWNGLPGFDLGSPDALLGTAYVLQGAGLGARVLVSRAEKLGFGAGNGAAHLAAMSNDIDGWRTFLALLEDTVPFQLDRAVVAARFTFGAALTAFESHALAEA